MLIAAAVLICSALPANAQFTLCGKRPAYDKRSKSFLLTVPEDWYGTARTLPITVDSDVRWLIFDGDIVFGNTINIPVVSGDKTYPVAYFCNGVAYEAQLRFTFLPILQLEGTFTDEYSQGEVWYTDPNGSSTDLMPARLKWAGSSTNRRWFHKHNFHIKFVDENGAKKDRSFFGLRSDNHWRLDAGMIDLGRIRNKTAHALWADMGTPMYYSGIQPNARNYSRGGHVEVFLNDSYMGFYDLTEVVDRKQMKLKSYNEEYGIFHGMLWKCMDDSWQTLFVADSAYDNTQQMWGQFKVMYPDIDDVCPTDFSLVSNAVNFVATSSNSDFQAHVGEYFDIPVLVDYYVFIQMLNGIDNTCKNMYFACYDLVVDKKLTLAVWDLDATVGQHWSDIDECYRAPEVSPEANLWKVSFLHLNRLYNRLMTQPSYRKAVQDRYWELRETLFNPDSLIARYADTYARLRRCGTLAREVERWSGDTDIAKRKLNFDNELAYLSDWIRRRVAYLDKTVFRRFEGDVNGDGEVNVADVNAIIDAILTGGRYVLLSADVNGDGEVNLGDVNADIDAIFGY